MLGKKTGGRRKGSPNKITAARKAKMAAAGEMPLEYALRIMRDKNASDERRDWACSQALRYCHPALSTVAVGGVGGGPIVLTWEPPQAA